MCVCTWLCAEERWVGPLIEKIFSFIYRMTVFHSKTPQTPLIIKIILIIALMCWSLSTCTCHLKLGSHNVYISAYIWQRSKSTLRKIMWFDQIPQLLDQRSGHPHRFDWMEIWICLVLFSGRCVASLYETGEALHAKDALQAYHCF